MLMSSVKQANWQIKSLVLALHEQIEQNAINLQDVSSLVSYIDKSTNEALSYKASCFLVLNAETYYPAYLLSRNVLSHANKQVVSSLFERVYHSKSIQRANFSPSLVPSDKICSYVKAFTYIADFDFKRFLSAVDSYHPDWLKYVTHNDANNMMENIYFCSYLHQKVDSFCSEYMIASTAGEITQCAKIKRQLVSICETFDLYAYEEFVHKSNLQRLLVSDGQSTQLQLNSLSSSYQSKPINNDSNLHIG